MIIKYVFDECEYIDLGIRGLSNFAHMEKKQSIFNKIEEKIESVDDIGKLEKIAGADGAIIKWRQVALKNILLKFDQNEYHKIVIKPNIILLSYRYIDGIIKDATTQHLKEYNDAFVSYRAQCKIKSKFIVLYLNEIFPIVVGDIINNYITYMI